jgi:hypothetical protein
MKGDAGIVRQRISIIPAIPFPLLPPVASLSILIVSCRTVRFKGLMHWMHYMAKAMIARSVSQAARAPAASANRIR